MLTSGIIAIMHVLPPTRHFARLVLAWFVLALGVAIASPLVKPQSWLMVCSAAGVVKLVNVDANGVAPADGQQIDCPLCWLAGAPPPAQTRALTAQRVPDAELPSAGLPHLTSHAAPPLPARGPPTFS